MASGRPVEVVVVAEVWGVAVRGVVTAADVVSVGRLVVDVAAATGTDVLVTPVVDMVAGGYVVSSAVGFEADVQAVSAPVTTQPARISERVRTKIPMRDIVPNPTLCA